MDDQTRLRWIAARILPLEAEARAWLRSHVRSLSAADIDDAVQEAYARLWTVDVTPITNPRAYFYTVLRNLIAEQARRARIVPLERMGEIESLRIISEEPGPERRVAARQELTQLLRAIAALPKQCRRAFRLRKFDELPQREIAKLMGVSEGTVEKHLAKALLRIRTAQAADGDGTANERSVDEKYHGSRRSPGKSADRQSD